MKFSMALLVSLASGETAVYNNYSHDYAYSYAQDYAYKPSEYTQAYNAYNAYAYA